MTLPLEIMRTESRTKSTPRNRADRFKEIEMVAVMRVHSRMVSSEEERTPRGCFGFNPKREPLIKMNNTCYGKEEQIKFSLKLFPVHLYTLYGSSVLLFSDPVKENINSCQFSVSCDHY